MEYVRYLVNSMDGESDPRNLMLLFRFIPNVLRHFPLTDTVTEEMFSVLECYFPVDFTPVRIFFYYFNEIEAKKYMKYYFNDFTM